jgi:hypothetical protein
MKDGDEEIWRKLCEHASTEQDPEKLIELVEEIIEALEGREKNLRQATKTQRKTPMPGEPAH